MRKILALALCLAFLLATMSCDDSSTVIKNESQAPVESSTEPYEYEYIVNTATKKYHTQFCTYAINISEESREATTDIDFIIERGYTPCGSCILR